LARGYLNQARLTGEKFVPDPYGSKSGARLYRTGDRAKWTSQGKLEFLGRRDEQVKVRGYRIELGEIETALLGIAEIAEAVVVVREDVRGDKRLVAYVVGRGNEQLNTDRVRRALKAKLPEYMVPGLLAVLDAMPLTVNGKIDRRALPVAEPTRTGSYQAPRTAEEEVVAGIWAHVLEVERVGIDENFFELGGHSLLATRVMSRMREAFQTEIPLRVLFEAPNVRALAERIGAARQAGQGLEIPPILPVERSGGVPLSYAQQRLWFLDQLDPGSPLYNVYVGYRMKGELDLEALQWSIAELVRRHETLCTHFSPSDRSAVQVVSMNQPPSFSIDDLTALPMADREHQAQKILSQDIR
jgi:acyl carrier protein